MSEDEKSCPTVTFPWQFTGGLVEKRQLISEERDVRSHGSNFSYTPLEVLTPFFIPPLEDFSRGF